MERYFFAPSISCRRTIKGKTYLVRRIFTGEKDFRKTMEQLAVNQAYLEVRK